MLEVIIVAATTLSIITHDKKCAHTYKQRHYSYQFLEQFLLPPPHGTIAIQKILLRQFSSGQFSVGVLSSQLFERVLFTMLNPHIMEESPTAVYIFSCLT